MTDFWRVTHLKDNVPHVPTMTSPEFYWHVCTEQYEDAIGQTHSCDSTCEDPTCANQWAAWQLKPIDHMTYLGVSLDDRTQ